MNQGNDTAIPISDTILRAANMLLSGQATLDSLASTGLADDLFKALQIEYAVRVRERRRAGGDGLTPDRPLTQPISRQEAWEAISSMFTFPDELRDMDRTRLQRRLDHASKPSSEQTQLPPMPRPAHSVAIANQLLQSTNPGLSAAALLAHGESDKDTCVLALEAVALAKRDALHASATASTRFSIDSSPAGVALSRLNSLPREQRLVSFQQAESLLARSRADFENLELVLPEINRVLRRGMSVEALTKEGRYNSDELRIIQEAVEATLRGDRRARPGVSDRPDIPRDLTFTEAIHFLTEGGSSPRHSASVLPAPSTAQHSPFMRRRGNGKPA